MRVGSWTTGMCMGPSGSGSGGSPPLRGPFSLSEISAKLATLAPPDLDVLVHRRLMGDPAGLPLVPDQEEPEELLFCAYEQDESGSLRAGLRGSVVRLLQKALVTTQAGFPVDDTYRERLFHLIGMTGAREAHDVIIGFLPHFEHHDARLHRRLLACLASLAAPEDMPLVPWWLAQLPRPDLSIHAFHALWRIDRERATATLPDVARALAQKEGADLVLARALALFVPALEEAEMERFMEGARRAFFGESSPDVRRILAAAFEAAPGVPAFKKT